MATFSQINNPTPFAIYDNESAFQSDADSIVTFVKRKLGDDVLSVELTKKHNLTLLNTLVLPLVEVLSLPRMGE